MNLRFFELHPGNSYSPNNQSRTPGDNLSESKPVKTSGSLSNSNEKDKKAICLDWKKKKNNFARTPRFFVHFFTVTTQLRRKTHVNTRQRFSFSFCELRCGPLQFNSRRKSQTFDKWKELQQQRWSMKQHYFTFWMTFSLPLPSSLLTLSIRDPQTRGR